MAGWRDVELVLDRWRAAERRFLAAAPGSPERSAAERDVAEARAAYQAAVDHPGAQGWLGDCVGPFSARNLARLG